MYHIHTTPGVITQILPQGEANRFYTILTEDLGMVRVHGQGVRLGKSKLKSHLTQYAIKDFSLVRGKEVWRLTSVKESVQYPEGITDIKAQKVFARILATLTRLVSGEERQPSLFAVVASSLLYLSQNTDTTTLEGVELITMVRILYELGYIEKKPYLKNFIDSSEITRQYIQEAIASRTTLTHDINTALKASQL